MKLIMMKIHHFIFYNQLLIVLMIGQFI